MYRKYVKRTLDILLSLIAFVILLPLMAVIALLIKIDSPSGPVIFSHERIGKNKKRFWIYKYRSMKPDAPGDVPTHMLDDPEDKFTRMGKFLRRSSIDELPQLINILKGDMSFVGPRPALWNQEDLVEERDKYGANDVLPGLTGWAQVNGRDELPITVKAAYDGEYVSRMSFLFDMNCIIKTFLAVLKAEGVSEGKNKDDNPGK